MRLGVCGSSTNPALASFAIGATARGHEVTWRGGVPFAPTDRDQFDAVMVYGWRGASRRMGEQHQRRGVPVLVVDAGYLQRDRGYYQIGVNRLAWLPPIPCPSDRYAALEMPKPLTERGDAILLCGQKPRDAQHGMDAFQVTAWANDTIQKLRRVTDRPLLWRPHPRARASDPALYEFVEGVSDPHAVPLREVLPMVHALVTYNSTSGTEAIVAGIPVFCDPCAMYADWADTDLAQIDRPRTLTPEARADYLSRVAYGQWLPEEMASGWAPGFLLETVLPMMQTASVA